MNTKIREGNTLRKSPYKRCVCKQMFINEKTRATYETCPRTPIWYGSFLSRVDYTYARFFTRKFCKLL